MTAAAEGRLQVQIVQKHKRIIWVRAPASLCGFQWSNHQPLMGSRYAFDFGTDSWRILSPYRLQ